MKLFNILFGIILLGFSSLSSAALCTGVAGFTEVNGDGFINPDPAITCQLDGDNLTPQNSTFIGSQMEIAFELAPGSLNFLQDFEVPQGQDDVAVGSDTISFSDLTAFNYLAVHYGNGELFFAFDNAITAFTLTGLPRGLSNYRTYNLSEVPVPAAGWLFGTALIGLMGLRRRVH
ncbi:MAG: VPLPA-CTERM sorting domain-containing protein [Pseudomonadota bacterium]